MPKRTQIKADGSDKDSSGLGNRLFSKEIETLTRTDAEMKMELTNTVTQLENSKFYKKNE